MAKVGGRGSDSGVPVANCSAEVNDVSSPSAKGATVTAAPARSNVNAQGAGAPEERRRRWKAAKTAAHGATGTATFHGMMRW